MKMIRCVLFIFLLFLVQNSFSQTILKGKIESQTTFLDKITVINLTNFSSVNSVNGGYFSISAKAKDTLIFSGTQIVGAEIILKEDDFLKDYFVVNLQVKSKELEEVKITKHKHINAVNMGIVSKDVKRFTPAERRLFTRTKMDLRLGFNPKYDSDPMLTSLSSNRNELIQNLIIERKELLLIKINNKYDDFFLTNQLKIKEKDIAGFKFFILDNKNFVTVFHTKNNSLTNFILCDLAIKFNNLKE